MFKGFKFDFTGVNPANQVFGNSPLKAGYYKGIIKELRDHETDGQPACWLEMGLEGGLRFSEYMQYPLEKGQKTANGKDDFAPKKWAALLTSTGAPAEKIKGIIPITEKLVGKPVHFYYEPPATPDDEYGRLTFVTKEACEAGIAAGGQGGVETGEGAIEATGGTGTKITQKAKAPKANAQANSGNQPPPAADEGGLDALLT